MNKYDHVRNAPGDGSHTCHWPGCQKIVKPACWGCGPHWFTLPRHIRNLIWHSYRKGQEVDKRPSRHYIEAARKAQEWIEEYQRNAENQGRGEWEVEGHPDLFRPAGRGAAE